MGKKKGGGEKKGKGPKSKSKHKNVQVWKKYEIGDGLKRKGESCPRCGSGTFVAGHKNRKTCGKCGYSETAAKKEE